MACDRPGRAALTIGLLLWVAYVAVFVSSHAQETARALELPAHPWVNRFFDGGLFVALGAIVLATSRLLVFAARSGRRWRRRQEVGGPIGTSGVVMVEFTLVFPIFAMLLSMTFQMILLINASLVVRYAGFAAARSAIVHLERNSIAELDASIVDPTNDVERTAQLVLASISPKDSSASSDAAAGAIYEIIKKQDGLWGDEGYKKRLTYAAKATTVTVDLKSPDILGFGSIPLDPRPRQVDLTVTYDFHLDLPGIYWWGGATRTSPLGSGYAYRITKTVRLQSTGARAGHPSMLLTGTPLP